MNTVLLIARRELGAYLRTWTGYVIAALMLAIVGLLFNTYGLGGGDKKSADVLRIFFEVMSALVAGSTVFLAMRLFAEERQLGTMPLLYSSPVRDWEIVAGKYLSAIVFLALMLGASLYMPLLIFVNGKVSVGHIVAGYLGLLLLGSGTLAISMFGSALARTQIIAVVLSAVMVIAVYCFVYVAPHAERPLNDVFGALAYFPHFRSLEGGLVQLKDVAYYALVSYVFLFSATRVLEARRWR
jgi:ABC-2 type transport system permease protein